MSALEGWLEPLRASVPEVSAERWRGLVELVNDLEDLVESAPPPDATTPDTWSQWLLALRRTLAHRGHRGMLGSDGPIWQTLAQFVAGFHDLDLRDCVGPGHGAMILDGASDQVAAHWRARMCAGELVGIAATERHGGSRVREITTRARLHPDGRWRISGEKCWVSRLRESAGFVVFFRDPDAGISAGVIEGTDGHIEREVIEPSGLGGWSWGVLRLHEAPFDPSTNLIGRPGDGLNVFHRHFAGFRPLVTATALGTAAGVHARVVSTLAARVKVGALPRVRDSVLVTIGRTQAEITAALLAAVAASRLAANGDPRAGLASRVGKAAGVDTAIRAVAELAPLIGASGFRRAHPIAKARADLTGLLYADGIHDSLYRSGGIELLRERSSISVDVRRPDPARREFDAAA